jgi:hypothetical protein
MSIPNNYITSLILLAFAAVAWFLICYAAEQELKDWYVQKEEIEN